MLLGKDFFKIVRFIIIIIKLLAETFGDKEDNDNANNHLSDL